MTTEQQPTPAERFRQAAGSCVLSSANCIYPGIPLANYRIMLEVWRQARDY